MSDEPFLFGHEEFFRPPIVDKDAQLINRHWSANQIALRFVAADLAQQFELGRRLDAFRQALHELPQVGGAQRGLFGGHDRLRASLTQADRLSRVVKAAKRLTDDQWQFKSKGKNGVIKTDKNGESTTRLVKDACIFLNRPDFHRGPGCALHLLAMDNNESYLPLKPEVCWQLPLRREDEVDALGHIRTTIRQWDRADWSKGGETFHWWCTESPEAFCGSERVVDSLREELIALVGQAAYDTLLAYLNSRRSTPVPHPAVRRR